ncbi:MAG: hypothetical protein ACXWK5_02905 [Myxococcaceae bacterium]
MRRSHPWTPTGCRPSQLHAFAGLDHGWGPVALRGYHWTYLDDQGLVVPGPWIGFGLSL